MPVLEHTGLAGALVNSGFLLFVFLTFCVTAIYCIEVLSAIALSPPPKDLSQAHGSMVVLIPAHNEEAGLAETLVAAKKDLLQDDRILVVADNCTDSTVEIAHRHGVDVITRTDMKQRGKGYALDFGIRSLEANPPEHVVILDADCLPEAGALDRIRQMSAHCGRPVQARYLMTLSEKTISQKVSVFAFRLKNWVRPQGLSNLGGPCLLTGSGMAFPWSTIAQADLAHGHLVEDMKLGLELAAEDCAPVFCSSATIVSPLPQSEDGAKTQRSRWVRGHLSVMGNVLMRLPGLMTTGNGMGVVLSMSILVPPLTVLIVLQSVAVFSSLLLTVLFSLPDLAVVLAFGTISVFTLATLAAWWKFGRDIIPASDLFGLVGHVLIRIARYPVAIFRPKKSGWERTERGSDTPGK